MLKDNIVDQHGNPIKSSQVSDMHITRGRITQDRDVRSGFTRFDTHKQANEQIDFKLKSMTEQELENAEPTELIDSLILSSPSLSRARTDIQKYVNNGYTIDVVEKDQAALDIIDRAIEEMARKGETFKTKINKLVSSGYIKGAFYLEAVFRNDPPEDPMLEDPVEDFIDLRVLDPFRMSYREAHDEVRGDYIEYGEVIEGEFVPINTERVQYIPLNPTDSSPIGIPMISSAIFPIIFKLGMYKAARQVVDSQAWPKGIVTIDREKMAQPWISMDNVQFDSEAFKKNLKDLQKAIEADMKNAPKNEVFVYGSEVGYQIISGMNKANLDGVKIMMDSLDVQIVRGLKQYPTTFGLAEGNALSTSAAQQTEGLVIFVEWFQEELEAAINQVLKLILRAENNSSTPVFSFKKEHAFAKPHRSKAFTEKVNNLINLTNAGLISPSEGRKLLLDPEGIEKIHDLLEEPLPSDVREPTNAKINVPEEEGTGSQPPKEEGSES